MKDICVVLGLFFLPFCLPENCPRYISLTFPLFKECFILFLLRVMKCLKSLDTYNSFFEKLVQLVVSAIFFFFVPVHAVTCRAVI